MAILSIEIRFQRTTLRCLPKAPIAQGKNIPISARFRLQYLGTPMETPTQ